MNELIEWLKAIEQRASGLYAEAAVILKKDRELAAFLCGLTQNETTRILVRSQSERSLPVPDRRNSV